MDRLKSAGAAMACVLLAGCAHIDFGDSGLLYYEPVPYLFVSVAADCASTATLVMLPGKQKSLKFVEGYGSAALSVTLNNGMIATVGQTVDNAAGAAATITSLAALATAAAASAAATRAKGGDPCTHAAMLYKLDGDGKPVKPGIPFP